MYKTFARFYDQLGWARYSHTRARLILDYIRDHAPHTKSLLDLACGTGEFAMLMAGQGLRVTGLDISAEMLTVARRKARRNRRTIEFQRGNMARFRIGRRFDLVTCNYDSLNHLLTENDVHSTFRHTFGHLARGGAFIFDVNTLSGLRTWRFQNTWQRDDSVVLRHGTFDPETGVATLFIDGFAKATPGARTYTRFQESFAERGYPVRLLHRLLKSAGFARVMLLGSSAGKTASQLEREPRVVFCARKT